MAHLPANILWDYQDIHAYSQDIHAYSQYK